MKPGKHSKAVKESNQLLENYLTVARHYIGRQRQFDKAAQESFQTDLKIARIDEVFLSFLLPEGQRPAKTWIIRPSCPANHHDLSCNPSAYLN